MGPIYVKKIKKETKKTEPTAGSLNLLVEEGKEVAHDNED